MKKLPKTTWTKIGHRLDMSIDGSVIRQERDLADFLGTDTIKTHYGMVPFDSDEKYWYFCKDSYLIKMLEVKLGRII
jgi:hypothetical protein